MADAKPVPPLSVEDIARFWSHVDMSGGPDACWPWTLGFGSQGYGKFSAISGGKKYSLNSNRVAYYLGHNDNPNELVVCHTCDNPPCCNWRHLWKGTIQDNMRDCFLKGRRAKGDRHKSRTHPESIERGDDHYHRRHPETIRRGEQHGRALLSDAQVLEIRSAHKNGTASGAGLAKQYGVSKYVISKILTRKTWKHLD